MSPNLPIEVQQLDPYHSVSLSPFIDSLIKAIFSGNATKNFGDTLQNFWLLLPDYAVAIMMRIFTFSFLLSLLLVVFVIWTANNVMRIRKQLHDNLQLVAAEAIEEESSAASVVNEKWQKVITHINSENPSDWKLAILECDIMLADILTELGYHQESISEQLKAVDPSDFLNIENAWEAHKIRNQIAHEGSEFAINEREAKRVIGLYETVFREFEYI